MKHAQELRSVRSRKTGFIITKRGDRIERTYIIWAIYLHIKAGSKVFRQRELENNSYFIISGVIVATHFT